MLAQGPEVEAFEEEFSRTVSGHHCVAVNSGTSALHLGLLATGIKPGDEVIVPSFTFAATANAVSLCGATPIFVDIDIDTFTIDTEAVSAAITPRTSGIMPVHLYGHPAKMDLLSQIADKHSLMLFEDAAQAHGSSHFNINVGHLSDIATFSFYPGKNLGAYGDAGIITTNNFKIYKKLRKLRNLGSEKKFIHENVGLNSRLDTIQAIILNEKLKNLSKYNSNRRNIAKFYDSKINNSKIP